MTAGCVVCGNPKHARAYACTRCKKILDRVEMRRTPEGTPRRFDREARLTALKESWRDGAFHCAYTGVRLIDDAQQLRDHRYLTFEHQVPGDEASVVVTCSLVTRMKTDLTHDEFKRIVTELAKTFAGGQFDERAFPEGKRPPAL